MDNRARELHEMLGKTVHIEVDRPIGYVHGDITYPVNYGYIPNLFAGDGEEQDVYILGVDEPISSFDGRIVGAIRRHNDCEDKLIAAPAGMVFHQGEIAQAVHFQEQYFDYTIDSLFRKSCGVLPYRVQNGKREYLIVFEQFSQCWSLPKGHMEAGETETDTALRELFEETGLTAQLDTSLCAAIEYPVGGICRKQVVFFPGKVEGEPKVRQGEIETHRWVTAEQLKDYLFADTVEACRKLIAQLS
jgi:8-oxo-dGTP pyrophosphatase MutT (NUDIX family)